MLIQIHEVFSKAEVAVIRRKLDEAGWVDGRTTAGIQSKTVKQNQQLDPMDGIARELGQMILERLSKDPLFISAALPNKILPPMFNKYETGETFGFHIDNALRVNPHTSEQLRTDLSMTLFFSEPEEYEGGELHIEDHYGSQRLKLPAGDLVLYPSTSLHKVEPVTAGARVSSFFWLQSLVRSSEQRAVLFDMDQNIQKLSMELGASHPQIVALTGTYHNLIRLWTEV